MVIHLSLSPLCFVLAQILVECNHYCVTVLQPACQWPPAFDRPWTLQSFILDERKHGRFTHEDFQEVPVILGFSAGGTLCVEYDKDVLDEFVEEGSYLVCLVRWSAAVDSEQCLSVHYEDASESGSVEC